MGGLIWVKYFQLPGLYPVCYSLFWAIIAPAHIALLKPVDSIKIPFNKKPKRERPPFQLFYKVV